jgi:hypothetical protein
MLPGDHTGRAGEPRHGYRTYLAGPMASRKRLPLARTRSAAAGSWLALLAAVTLGDGADTVRAEVRAHGLREGAYRLVVQSYDASDGRVPGPDARPVGSLQRAVTADELQHGVHVSLLELRRSASHVGRPMVVAWIEAGEPNLEFDGRTARPRPGNMYGVARRDMSHDEAVHISLNRTLSA